MENTLFVSIVVDDPLVSEDIADIFAFWQAGSVCRVFDAISEVRAVPQAAFDPGLVFIAASKGLLDLTKQDLAWLKKRAVITLDLMDQAQFPTWQHLARPFTQAQVIQAAQALVSVPGCRCASA